MTSPTLIKVLGAFLAGLILVMGGALIYSTTREPRHPIAAVQPTPVVRQSEPQAPVRAVENPAPASAPLQRSSESPRGPWKAPVQGVVPPTSVAQAQTAQAQVSQITQPSDAATETVQSTPAITKAAAPEPPPALPEATGSAQPHALESAGESPAAPPPYVATLQPGTTLTIELREALSSDRNRAGDVFRGSLDSPLVVNGFTVAAQGATVLGKVVTAQKARLMGSASELTLILTEITTGDGQLIRVETSPWDDEGSKIKLRDAPKVAVGAAYGAAVGAISGAAKGAGVGEAYDPDKKSESPGMNQKVIVVPIGSHLTFRLTSPVKITDHSR